jgi:hypothetical protein
MKVYIGPYKDWFGPYQMADRVFFWLEKHPDDPVMAKYEYIYRLHDWLGDFLAGKDKHETWLMKFCQWLQTFQHRKIKVKIHGYDIWSAEHTLALVTLPILKALKEHKHGSPDIDLSDVPDELWPTALAGPNNYYTDDTVHKRWEWVLDEMIWTFEQLVQEDDETQFYDHSEANDPNDGLMEQARKIKVDYDGLERHNERKANGLRLFGKYYRNLWD